MGLWDKIRGEFIDIIEWTEPSQNEILAYRFPRYNNEIKMGAQLVVREGQVAVFVNEGQLADQFGPGTYTLETRNLPVLSTLRGWKYGFNSPFKAEVYFISMRQWTDLKWGTQNPILTRDPEFGPVRIRAFGTYAMRVQDPATFLRQLVVTDPSFETFEITKHLRNIIVSRFADALAQMRMPILDLAGNYEHLGQRALERIRPDLEQMGLALTQFLVENISLPPEVEEVLDKRTRMGVLGDLQRYAQYQTAEAIGEAARNPSGLAGMGAGIGAGAAIGQQMAAHLAGPGTAPPAMHYYLIVNGQQVGPYTLQEVTAQVQRGAVSGATPVWRQGMANWAAASSVAELAGLFPPPPPGQAPASG
ncbi:MAG: antifreeze protein [Gemmataceae bacterium]